MFIDLLFIAIIITFIIDLSGFIDSIKPIIWKILFPKIKYNPNWRIKPFDCSLCSTFWIGIIYLLFTSFTLKGFLYVILLAWFTPTIKDLLIALKELFQKWIGKI